jgi:transposase-like protein
MRFVSYADRKKVAAALRPIYTAPTVEAAETELLAFADSDLGRKYPAAVATWERAWERFIPFLLCRARHNRNHAGQAVMPGSLLLVGVAAAQLG